MVFRCPSAAGFCFLEHPIPTEEFCRPCGWLTGFYSRPHWGYHVPHYGAATGEGALSTPGPRCHKCMYSDHTSSAVSMKRNLSHWPNMPYSPSTGTFTDGASSRVHSRSPVQFSPCPVPPDGWEFPWALSMASHPIVTNDARTDRGQAWTLARVDILPLQ